MMAYDEVESCRLCGEIMDYKAVEKHMLDVHGVTPRCRPVWGSCNLPAGHKGPHNAHAEPEPDNGDGPPKNITIGMETLRRLARGEAVVIDGVALFAADDFPNIEQMRDRLRICHAVLEACRKVVPAAHARSIDAALEGRPPGPPDPPGPPSRRWG